MKVTLYDPPEGWKYGFPKKYLPKDGEQVADTLARDGYPPKEADWASKYCRYWEAEVETNNPV